MRARFVLLAFFTLTFLSFQNCSPARFGADPLRYSQSLSAGDDDYVVGQTSGGLKFIFIVDNSYSMSAFQSELSQGIESIMRAVDDGHAEFFVKSMTPLLLNGSSTAYSIQNGKTFGANADSQQPDPLLPFSSFVEVPSELSPAPQVRYQDLASALMTGTKGSDHESGLGSMIHELNAKQPIFQKGDILHFILITDEDNYAGFEARNQEDMTISGFPSVKKMEFPMTPAFQRSFMNLKRLDCIRNVTVNQDGVQGTEKRSAGALYYDLDSERPDGEAQLANLGCESFVTTPMGETGVDVSFADSQCQSPTSDLFFIQKYRTTQGLAQLAARKNADCLLSPRQGSARVSRISDEAQAMMALLGYTGTYQNLSSANRKEFQIRAFMKLIEQKLGFDSVFFSGLIHDGTCPLANSQSVGQTYQSLASRLGSMGEVLPICQTWRYSDALRSTALAAQSIAQRRFPLRTAGASVAQVFIRRNGEERVLEPGEFRQNEFFVELIPGLVLPGDHVFIQYAR